MIEKDFVKEGLKRTRIDEYLETKLERAGYGGMDIQVTPVGTMVIVYAEKPGMVIGRGGKTVRAITKTLKNNFDLENPQVEVKEVDVPELNPRIMAHKVVAMLQRGMQFRRVAYSIIRRIMSAGAQGVEVTISGKREVIKVKLQEEVVDPDDIEMLEDLIVAATNEALRKVEEESTAVMSKLTGGLGGLGGGLPF